MSSLVNPRGHYSDWRKRNFKQFRPAENQQVEEPPAEPPAKSNSALDKFKKRF